MLLALCAVFGHRALAQSHEMMSHHGVPTRVVADQRVGPYVASLWIDRDVGDGAVYVVLEAANGSAFTRPTAVRVAIAPTSGRFGEVVHEAHPQPVRSGARYMTDVMFDRAERWNVRVIVEGSAGGGQLVAQVESTSNAALGPLGISLASTPFVLVALVYWRSRQGRHPAPRLSSHA